MRKSALLCSVLAVKPQRGVPDIIPYLKYKMEFNLSDILQTEVRNFVYMLQERATLRLWA